MTVDANWQCKNCGEEVDAGYPVCWSCGADQAGELNPHFEVDTAPIEEATEPYIPPPWMALVIVLTFPVLMFYGLTKWLFPLQDRERFQFSLKALLVWTTIACAAMGYSVFMYWVYQRFNE